MFAWSISKKQKKIDNDVQDRAQYNCNFVKRSLPKGRKHTGCIGQKRLTISGRQIIGVKIGEAVERKNM